MSFYRLARNALFALDPETAHDLALRGLDAAARCPGTSLLRPPAVHDPVQLMGLTLPNRVGLAAGLDKNGAHIDGLAALGFGFIEVGTVTPRPQPGNPRPRLFRLPEREAIINRMGFNNGGMAAFLANVQRARWRGILGLNIGKNATTPIESALDDYLAGLSAVYAHASYVTVNISSPNTANLRQLQGADELDRMLEALRERQLRLADEHGRYVPLALKIAPDLSEAQIEAIAARLQRHGVDGVIATNTTLSREGVAGLAHADQAGGLSGAPVEQASNRVIAQLRATLPSAYPIIGVGGIVDAASARAKIEAGATAIQLYTGLIYRGPGLVETCARALAALRDPEASTPSTHRPPA